MRTLRDILVENFYKNVGNNLKVSGFLEGLEMRETWMNLYKNLSKNPNNKILKGKP